MNKLILPETHEIRVELIRLYPSAEDHAKIRQLQSEVRAVINHIVRSREDVARARYAYAKRNGLIACEPPSEIPRPCLSEPTTAEEKQAVKQAWKEYKAAKKAQGPLWAKWFAEVRKAVPSLPELDWRKDKYQQLRQIYGKLSSAVLLRDVCQRLAKTKGANYKGRNDWVPLVWGNGDALKTGSFYGLRRNVPWYNALITVNGMKIPGRLRRPMPGKVVQGVTLTQKADGWYAAVKCIVLKRVLPETTKEAIGIDVGQTDIVATVDVANDVYAQRNDRTSEQRSLLSALQSVADLSRDPEQIQQTRRKIARIHLRAKRQVDHWLNAEFLPKLAAYDTIVVEKLAKGFKSNQGSLSCMHQVLDAIKSRFGSRVREVECAYTSQTCSQCGNCAKTQRNGKKFLCEGANCGYTDDADLNAARNILAKGLELLAA